MRVIVAPSGFKECLEAPEVASAIAAGIRRVDPLATVDEVPLVDGGEGTARAMAAATGGRLVPVTVTGPVGRPVTAHLALLGGPGPRTAVVEMAAAAGLRLVPADARDPGATTTRGVGDLIRAALDEGARRILVGCGDSGTCDGGAGALQALGAHVRDSHGREIGLGGHALLDVSDVDPGGLDPRLREVEVLVACNPHNVLTGPRGVARVFGPQKGATPRQVEHLSAAMDRWAAVLHQRFGADLRRVPGGGASGGLGAGLAAALGARLVPRFEVLLPHLDLEGRLRHADLVVTAEGAIDAQTPRGKVPAEVARLAKRHGKPVIALAGTIGDGAQNTYASGIDAYTGILDAPLPLPEAIRRAPELLTDAAEHALRLILVGASLARTTSPSLDAGARRECVVVTP
ncbi:glycerate kinase [Streptoalloteichus tenebrarius]|uniref:Glycerate kinase n=1 Tax=Streptoalloteichus tenebrarius (strain ATCC 17920 / DSM 40477 / JCM 4838 / CBS 697.72 / NBRC 16177 / NCIMB 11028 / NRRL B-12390 / A12253. 1 / ISP 5477) TaxID=1933 RepID=A0ABT1HUT3_STRSD|nr:glycerate kinase [Streptoalloteichus tenebrarius]MCP2259272.1 glycerate kinase [Streptoalloteichus tenebrarius]BFE99031.1 glycerate kinase [Streptoalloteichus tenebrarius]